MATRALLSHRERPLPYLAGRAAVTWGLARASSDPCLLNARQRAAFKSPGYSVGGREHARWGCQEGGGARRVGGGGCREGMEGWGRSPREESGWGRKQSPFWSRPDGQPPRGS